MHSKYIVCKYRISLGYYAALISKSGRLTSPDYNFTQSEYCVNFWYFLEGDRNTQLKIQKDMRATGIISVPTTVWTDIAEPDVKGQWMHARASITGLRHGDYDVSNPFILLDQRAKFMVAKYGSIRSLSDLETICYLLSPKINNYHSKPIPLSLLLR